MSRYNDKFPRQSDTANRHVGVKELMHRTGVPTVHAMRQWLRRHRGPRDTWPWLFTEDEARAIVAEHKANCARVAGRR